MGSCLGSKFNRLIQENNFKNILLVNCKCQSFDISYEASLGHGDSSCSNHDPGIINGLMPRGQILT